MQKRLTLKDLRGDDNLEQVIAGVLSDVLTPILAEVYPELYIVELSYSEDSPTML